MLRSPFYLLFCTKSSTCSIYFCARTRFFCYTQKPFCLFINFANWFFVFSVNPFLPLVTFLHFIVAIWRVYVTFPALFLSILYVNSIYHSKQHFWFLFRPIYYFCFIVTDHCDKKAGLSLLSVQKNPFSLSSFSHLLPFLQNYIFLLCSSYFKCIDTQYPAAGTDRRFFVLFQIIHIQ